MKHTQDNHLQDVLYVVNRQNNRGVYRIQCDAQLAIEEIRALCSEPVYLSSKRDWRDWERRVEVQSNRLRVLEGIIERGNLLLSQLED